MKKQRFKGILICLEGVTRLASSGGGMPAHHRADSPPSYSASLTPGVKIWVKPSVFRKAAASLNPSVGSSPSAGERIGGGRKNKDELPDTLGPKQFPKEAGPACPQIWRQKSEFVLKSRKKKAPC